MADTADYVNSVVAYAGGRASDFWEFGHLLWRPLGWLLFVLFRPVTRLFVGDDTSSNVTLVFLAVNWLAGLLSVFAVYGLSRRFCERRWVVYLTTIFFIFSQGFLNFAQTGSSYIPGLSLLLLGLYILATRVESAQQLSLRTPFLASLALAGAACLWFPYVLSFPAAIALPLFVSNFDRRAFRTVIATACFVTCFFLLAYCVVAVGILGMRTIDGFRAWMSSASHDTDIRGFTRMVFGFARSFIYMGNDGVIFKRYLLKDPFNPVTIVDLLRLSLWKLGLFYALIAAVCASLLRSAPGRRMWLLLALNGIPVILFAVRFDGGAIERYLPLYPLIIISLSFALCSKSLSMLKYIAVACTLALIVSSVGAMSKPVLDRQQQTATERIGDLLGRLKPQSRILTVTWQDELINFGRSFPFHPINRLHTLRIGALVTPGTTYSSEWREGFASLALKAWQDGGDVWVSKRALSQRPRAEWNWVEGDERRVSWPDFSAFFFQLDMSESSGGDDGFIMIPPSAKNIEILQRYLHAKQP